jgi:hypothetical protein
MTAFSVQCYLKSKNIASYMLSTFLVVFKKEYKFSSLTLSCPEAILFIHLFIFNKPKMLRFYLQREAEVLIHLLSLCRIHKIFSIHCYCWNLDSSWKLICLFCGCFPFRV